VGENIFKLLKALQYANFYDCGCVSISTDQSHAKYSVFSRVTSGCTRAEWAQEMLCSKILEDLKSSYESKLKTVIEKFIESAVKEQVTP
jgi:hypothetical protein